MKGLIKGLGYRLEDKLKDICGEITPGKRLMVILVMLLLFTILNLYFTFTSISNWGRQQERREQLKIEHIKRLKPEKLKSKDTGFDFNFIGSEPEVADSINSINNQK